MSRNVDDRLPSPVPAFSRRIFEVVLLTIALMLTASCWAPLPPAYVYDVMDGCYQGSSIKKNPYGQVIREHYDFYEDWDSMMSQKGMQTASALVELGVPVNEPVANGSTPLMWASWTGFQNLVELFVAAGADVNAQAKDGVTPLFCSMFNAFGVKGTTELLLAAGAKVDTPALNGTTPLMIASRRVNLAVVEVLLEAGADPNLQDADGMTALMFAAMANGSDLQRYTVELLLEKGADLSLRNRQGKTALMFARANQNEELVSFFERFRVTP
jgi:ankyrin repeat protein